MSTARVEEVVLGDRAGLLASFHRMPLLCRHQNRRRDHRRNLPLPVGKEPGGRPSKCRRRVGVAHAELAGDVGMAEDCPEDRGCRRAEGTVFREGKGSKGGVALQNGRHGAGYTLLLHFGVFEEGPGLGEGVLGPNQVGGQVGAAAVWEWRMLSSLTTLTWLKTTLRNEFAVGPEALYSERAKGVKMPFRSTSTPSLRSGGAERTELTVGPLEPIRFV